MTTIDLDLQTTAITADALRAWREAQTRRPHEVNQRGQPHPAPSDMAARLGVAPSTWGHWERHGVPRGISSAMVSEHMDCGEAFELDAVVTAGEVVGLCALVGGAEELARQLTIGVHTVRKWCKEGCASNAARLLRWLCDEMAGAIDEIMEAA